MAAGRRRAGRGGGGAAWLAGAAILAAALGIAAGAFRLAAIDAGAFAGRPGEQVSVWGFVAAVPRRSEGEVRVRLDTADGPLLLEAPEPVPDLAVGHEVRARGTIREPRPWEAGYLARYGIARVVESRRIEPTERRRGGLAYLTDSLRERAEQALGRGTPAAEAALLRGFVLGEDDRIDPATIDDFQRSGLAHLLAVSGQNVLLLALLAMPLLGLLGVPLRARLACVLALIAIYVPVAGAGPSIQRAGVMGAAAIVATLAGRAASRWYALLLAAAVTLALNPRTSADAGWQLSFAAVVGIALWAAPLREALSGTRARAGEARGRGPGARAILAEGAAVTLAATIATAPLMAHHFERLSVAALPANLLAAPAVAPVMWLGMLAAAAAQLPWVPVEPLTFLAGLLAAYVEQIAHWLGAPGWAQVSAPITASVAVAVSAALLGAGWLLRSRAGSKRGLRPRRWAPSAVALALAAALWLAPWPDVGEPPPAGKGLQVTVLDVGQGDSILLDPSPGDPVLVDTGPPEAEVGDRLEAAGVERLAAVILTHDQRDHSGGLPELLHGPDVQRVAYGWPAPPLLADARAASVAAIPLAEGSEIDSGGLRLEVLWPPSSLLDGPAPSEPNDLSVVLLARWHHFRMLLTGDGEAAAIPINPGPVDVLKVAHHGSADAGLDRLLDRSPPRLAVISVGEDNPYGHPTPETLSELAAHRVPVLRTDRSGDVTIDVDAEAWSVHGDQ